MNVAISMLRGINVGGQKKVPMDELKECYESLGFSRVQTYIQSGNVVFSFGGSSESSLTQKLEKGIRAKFGFDVPVMIRTREEMQQVIRNFPFTRAQEERAHVTFLSAEPATFPAPQLEGARAQHEEFAISGREVYLFLPHGYGRTRLSNAFFEKQLKVLATTRNWRTVRALHALAQG